MKRTPKVPPIQEGQSDFKSPEGLQGVHRGEFRQGRDGDFRNKKEPGLHGPPKGKRMHGKPEMGKIISFAKVIPYFFILAFFIQQPVLLMYP
jgi:hypothetical protein